MSAKTEVRPLEPAEFAAWSALVSGSPDGSIYATPEYLELMCRVAGGRFRILGIHRGEELVGGLPLYQRDGGAGAYVSPRLLLYYLGPVLRRFDSKYPSQETSRGIEALTGLAVAVDAMGLAKITLKGRHTVADARPFQARGWTAWPSYSYVVPLGDLPAQWQKVEQNLRRLVDRCAADGVTFTDDDDFEGFLRLHRLTMDHHGAELYLPEPAFAEWFRSLHAAGLCRLFQARLPGDQAIAAQIVLLSAHPVTHTVCAGTDPEHRRLGAAAFLRWRAFEALAALGKAGNDLTDAALNPVTHFKSQFGGDLVTNLVLESPGTSRWRAARAAEGAVQTLRGAAGRLLRRLRPGRER